MKELELQLVEMPKTDKQKLEDIQDTYNKTNSDLREIYSKLSKRQDLVFAKRKERKAK